MDSSGQVSKPSRTILNVLAQQHQITQLKILIIPLTIVMVYPVMSNLNIDNLKNGLNPRLQTSAQTP